MVALEERLTGKSDLEREKDNELVRNKKLVKLVERYKQELHETVTELNTLKASMLESSGLKVRSTLL